ncbi:Predicted dehydrogenase [Salinibacillus kushneri]|uniref:Predicted dehydrogenase n=1 Tax=Salinibacillus kushneri TaxID=237682 RepID=A0A1H9Z096_9BACI|nr:Gfo/Idh/MocA family oxidoreductase [Salinibacillus kushneri]SES74281.1 Predicted dehydrogenase [Salinibacillus kushneri]
MKTCGIVLVGTAGYGEIYLKALQETNRLDWIKGVVDIHPESSSFYTLFQQMNIPIYTSLESFYEQNQAELAIISTPIHFHANQAITAMKNGSHVLCEKPVSGSLGEAVKMRQVRNETGRFLAIGFNWSFSDSVHRLKQDINNGLFGAPVQGQTIVLWPRTEEYYNRSNWAGKRFSPNGEPVFDSIANNAAAHFFHHLFYVLGSKEEQSARLKSLDIELYRANPIETFDTCAIRAKTDQSVDLYYYASHAVNEEYGPHFELEFEKASIRYYAGKPIKAMFNNGMEKSYGDPEEEHMNKLDVCIQAVVEGNKSIRCSIEAAYPHLLGMKYMHEINPAIPAFPSFYIRKNTDTNLTYVSNLAEVLYECYKSNQLPSERNIKWAHHYKTVQIPEKFSFNT